MLHQTKKGKTKTLSEKVTELILHPSVGDGSSNESDDGEAATKPRVVQFDDDEYELPDARSSEIRKKNIKLLSEQSAKYRGKISTRNDYDNDYSGAEKNDTTESEVGDDSDNENEDIPTKPKEFSMKLQKDFSFPDEDKSEDDDGSDEDEDINDSDIDEDDDDHSETSDVEVNIQETDILGETNRHAEIQKGECVKNQLNLWEKLLEVRIHSQKLLNKANTLPQPDDLQNEQKENADVKRTARETQESCVNLLDRLLQLQNCLYNQFSEIKSACVQNKQKRSLPLADSKLEAPPSKRFALHLEQRFSDFKPYRNSVLRKWDDRTKLLTPGAGSKKKTLQEDYDILKKIENAMLNRKTLVDKPHTLVTQSNSRVEGDENDSTTVVKTDVYDDTDFYHQQLRELIEYKSSGSTNASEVAKQLIELQKLRQKMKKKVDTRASKGRKIRYNVHKKLINFMAPHDATSWTEESKNELCKSLFSS